MTPVHCGLVLVVGSWPDLGSRRLKLPMARVQGSGPQGGARVEPPNGLHSRHREVVAGCVVVLVAGGGAGLAPRSLPTGGNVRLVHAHTLLDLIATAQTLLDLVAARPQNPAHVAPPVWKQNGHQRPGSGRGAALEVALFVAAETAVHVPALAWPNAIWSGMVETGGRERSEEWGGGVG